MISLKQMRAELITVSPEMSQLKNGLRTAFMKYDNKCNIICQTPECVMPFKPDMNDEQTSKRHSMCFNVVSESPFKEKMECIDAIVVAAAGERSHEWFKKPRISEDFVDINYTRIIRNGGEYADKFKFKTDKSTKFYNAEKEAITILDIPERSTVRAIVELRYVWINNGKFGATWVAKQVQYMKAPLHLMDDEIEFVDDD